MRQIAMTSALLAIALASCQQEDPNNIAIDEGNNAAAEIETLPQDETAANEEETAPSDNEALPTPPDAASAAIPAQYHGRWGMVPGDCTSTRGDNKGLITIADSTIKFYEALATLKEQRPAIATSFSGLFAFTGEGQNWQKVMTFTRTGDTLKRAEESGTFTYKRCA